MSVANPYIEFCREVRSSRKWRTGGFRDLSVPDQGRALGAMYRAVQQKKPSSKRPCTSSRRYRSSGGSRKRRLEDHSAAEISMYVHDVRDHLEKATNSRNKKTFSRAEIDALMISISRCAHEILRRWAARKPRDTYPTAIDIRAACTLARKTILGYDADHEYRTHKLMIDEGQYDSWIVAFMNNNDWKACADEQRRVGELPTLSNAQLQSVVHLT